MIKAVYNGVVGEDTRLAATESGCAEGIIMSDME